MLVEQEAPDLALELDSAGTHSYHLGHPPDPRSADAALKRGVDLSHLRARKVVAEDFTRFDLVLAMDRANLADLQRHGRRSRSNTECVCLCHSPEKRQVPMKFPIPTMVDRMASSRSWIWWNWPDAV